MTHVFCFWKRDRIPLFEYCFVKANYSFPNPNNPWVEKFPESTFIPSLVSTFTADFVAIKIGDVNASAKLNEEK